MNKQIRGVFLRVGDNIDTDQIYPGRYLALTDPAEIGKHCLEGVDPNIAETFPKGGIVVAGRNFGCGSSREHAPIALKNMGASAVVAESFARIFYRNAMNLALPLLVCPGIAKVKASEGEVSIHLEEGKIRFEETGEELACEPLGEHAMHILEAGGIKPLMRQKIKADPPSN